MGIFEGSDSGKRTQWLVKGSTDPLHQAVYNCMSYYAFVERTLTDVAQILSTKTRYQNLFEKEPAVQSALKELYTELAFLLQDIQSMVSKKCRLKRSTASSYQRDSLVADFF